jgi:hypothetical protein
VFVLALLILATAYSGAFAVAQWAPPALFLLIMLFAIVLREGATRLPDRWIGVSLAGAWGLAAWAALSAIWGASPGAALEGAGRLTMYAAIITLPFVAVRDRRALRIAGWGVVGGICLIGLYTLGAMLVDGPSIFLAGRLSEPIGYRNATALLFSLAYWPLIVAATARPGGRFARASCFGLAVLMLGLAFLTQSRGDLLGLGCGGLVALTLGPERVRRTWLALLSALLVACAAHWLLRPYDAFAHGGGVVSSRDIAIAAQALLALVALSTLIGFLIAVFDAGLRPASPVMSRVVRPLARYGLVVVLVLGLAGGLLAVNGDPVHELEVKWHQFQSLQSTNTSTTRYTSAGGQRYDLWRVALLELRANPVGGVGEGSYQFSYYRLRRTNRNLEDPHGLLFQIGAELGVVGLLLFALIPLGMVRSMRRRWRLASVRTRRSAAGLIAAGTTFLGQSLVEWIWRIPGLTALGLLCLAVAAALLARSASEHELGDALEGSEADFEGPGSDGTARARGRSRIGRATAGAVLLAAIALTLSLYLSNVYVNRARDELGISPAVQLSDARTASALDPWAVDPHYLEASALESVGRRQAARAQLQDAQRMEPTNLVPLGLLGDFEARGGDFAKARAYYARALALDPLDVGLQKLALTGGRPSGA